MTEIALSILSISLAILTEYADVLQHPKFSCTRRAVETFLAALEVCALLVTPTEGMTVSPDASDNRFPACAKEAQDAPLVTGNQRHFPFAQFETTAMVSPAACARIVAESVIG